MRGRWGWRPIMASLFVSVIVAACNVAHLPLSGTPTSTTVQQVTLTLRQTREPTVSPPGVSISEEPKTPTPTPNIVNNPVLLIAEPPTCYTTTTGLPQCLGIVRNPSSSYIEDPLIRVQSLTQSGEIIQDQFILLDQRIIQPLGYAPYRVRLDTPYEDMPALVVEVVTAQSVPQDRYLPILAEITQSTYRGGRYEVEVVLANDTEIDAENIWAVITLRNPNGEVAGYRVTPVSPGRLGAGEQMTITVVLFPHASDALLNADIFVEAQPARSTH